jgi:outer membrane protein OmpA-like peptidoglycan-associated protein
MNSLFEKAHDEQEESHWLSVSDLMAGLMMVFLFVAIALMMDAFTERDKIKQVAVAYQENQVAIFDSLNEEFGKDLEHWNAEIDEETLTFTFKSPKVLFKVGEIDLSDKYKSLLIDFFPRYMAVLEPYQKSINEVRIEGHTSSVWNSYVTDRIAYFNNMELSQGRTRSVLNFVFGMDKTKQYRNWIKSHVAAVGLSSSKPIYKNNGKEDRARSRRVSFRVITNADIQIKKILQGEG